MIDFYFDFVSPFGYFASLRIEHLARKYGLEVSWHPILVGVTVMKLMGMPPIIDIPLKGAYMRRELERYSKLFGVTTKRDLAAHPVNALAASRGLALLLSQGDSAAVPFAKACYYAYWQNCTDLNEKDKVVFIAERTGVSAVSIEQMIGEPGKDALRLAMDQAVARGVFGSPFFIIDDEPFFGVDKLELIELWLQRGTSGE